MPAICGTVFWPSCLAEHENAYSKSCEIRGDRGGTLSLLARQDFVLLKELFGKNLAELDRLTPGSHVWEALADYQPADDESRIFNHRVRDRILELAASLEQAEDGEQFQQAASEFYREFGVGRFGLNKAFRDPGRRGGGPDRAHCQRRARILSGHRGLRAAEAEAD